jgi:GDP-D-mannose 3', 5'-epimerase
MMYMITGAGGFIGGHLVARLLDDGHFVYGVDIKDVRDWHQTFPYSDHMVHYSHTDVGDYDVITNLMMKNPRPNVVVNLAADMGGMGFIENHKLDCMLSTLATVNVLRAAEAANASVVAYASSACVYPAYLQGEPDVAALREEHAYPALPEDGYGWEKLFGERMCRHFSEETELETRIMRFHNVYGPLGTWTGGREKAPAAMCRKVAEAKFRQDDEIEVWGDGDQTRSFMYVDDCVEGILRIIEEGSLDGVPINLGSSELVTINQLAELVMNIAGYPTRITHIDGPLGVRGRNSDNTFIKEVLDWEPSTSLVAGMTKTYMWVEEQVWKERSNAH